MASSTAINYIEECSSVVSCPASSSTFLSSNTATFDYLQYAKEGGFHFIGASITAQKKSYPTFLTELASEEIEQPVKISKKSMGSVGLLFGVTCWPDIELPRRSLTFIEFSTGDLNLGLTPLDKIESLLTELVFDILESDSIPIIIHNWRDDFRFNEGDLVRGIYNDVASKFNIPVIRNDEYVESEIHKNPNIKEKWFRDFCHTTIEGADAYAKHILGCLKTLASDNPSALNDVIHKRENKQTIEPVSDLRNYLHPSYYYVNEYVYSNTGQMFSYYDCPSECKFRAVVSGQLMGISLLSGPTSAWVNLFIDGEKVRQLRCFDRNSYYTRYILLPAFYDLSNSLVEISLADKPVDYSIAKKTHPSFGDTRRMQLVGLVGTDLNLKPIPNEDGSNDLNLGFTENEPENINAAISSAMEFDGLNSKESLALISLFLGKIKELNPSGPFVEFGARKSRISALLAAYVSENWLHVVEHSRTIELERLNKISNSISWHQKTSESFFHDDIHQLFKQESIAFTHHDAGHFFESIHTEISSICKYINLYGVIVLSDFNDNFHQIRAAYYYARYKESFPYELLLAGFNKAILVHESVFDFWEGYVLNDLLSDLRCAGSLCKLVRSDVSKHSRSFYLKSRKESEDEFYGTKFLGTKFYKQSAQLLN